MPALPCAPPRSGETAPCLLRDPSPPPSPLSRHVPSPASPDVHRPSACSVYGMQYREKSIARSLSRQSLSEMDDTASQAKFVEETAAEEEVVVTWPLINAVLVAIVLQYLVGYNIGVMVRLVRRRGCLADGKRGRWGAGMPGRMRIQGGSSSSLSSSTWSLSS